MSFVDLEGNLKKMNPKAGENLEDVFEKVYRESVQHFEKQSQVELTLFFNKSKLVLAKEKMHVFCKENSSLLLNKDEDEKDITDQSSHKTCTISKRKKTPSPREAKTLKQRKDHLRDSIDKIHSDHLFGKTKPACSRYHTNVNRRHPSYTFKRFISNMVKQKCLPGSSSSVCEVKNKFITFNDSKITTRRKEKTVSKTRSGDNSSSRVESCSHLPPLDDSGVCVDETTQGFQPLFSGHCGGFWKAIVEEN